MGRPRRIEPWATFPLTSCDSQLQAAGKSPRVQLLMAEGRSYGEGVKTEVTHFPGPLCLRRDQWLAPEVE